jgi:hypothetical protein
MPHIFLLEPVHVLFLNALCLQSMVSSMFNRCYYVQSVYIIIYCIVEHRISFLPDPNSF